VITDSIASLPIEICSRENLHVVPLILILPDGEYHNGVDIDPRRYYRLLREGKLSPKTSAPSPGDFHKFYEQLSRTNESVIVITAPKELSNTWESAVIASEMISENLPVQVIDSRVAGPAEGFVAIAAARLAASGLGLDTITDALGKVLKDVGFVVVLDTVKFLAESGRVLEAREWVKSVTRIYPVLCIINGQIRVLGLARIKSKAIQRMVNWLESSVSNKKVAMAFCHTDALSEATELAEKMQAICRPTESFITELTPVIGAHTGPGLVGVGWWVQSDKV
jgi:DegV family protein with EDD domain